MLTANEIEKHTTKMADYLNTGTGSEHLEKFCIDNANVEIETLHDYFLESGIPMRILAEVEGGFYVGVYLATVHCKEKNNTWQGGPTDEEEQENEDIMREQII